MSRTKTGVAHRAVDTDVKFHQRMRLLPLSLLVLGVLPWFGAQPQAARAEAAISRRVHFKRGCLTIQLKGTLTLQKEVHYVVRARKGQTLEARVTGSTPNRDVVFSITSPGGKSLMGGLGEDYDNAWSGKLPKTGDYRIELGMIESAASRYTLTLTLR